MAQLKLQYFCRVVKGSADELVLMMMEGIRPRGAPRKQRSITLRNKAVKPTRNARCWHKIGTVGERCSGSGHYLLWNLIRGTYLKKETYS